MATGCDIILATTVWAFKASECDRLNKQDPAFASSEDDPTCQRLAAIIECLELKVKSTKIGWDFLLPEMDKCIDTLCANSDVQEAIKRYYDEDYDNDG